VPPAVNTLEVLSSVTSNHTQLSTQLRDPARVVLYSLASGLAEVKLAPTVAAATWFEVLQTTEANTFFKIGECPIMIDEVRIVPHMVEGTAIGAMLSFQVDFGAAAIESVSFGFAVDDENYFTYEDPTGNQRSQYVNLGAVNKAPGANSTLFGLVGINGKDGVSRFYRAIHSLALANNKPAVVGISAAQRPGSSEKIEVSYNYLSRREIAPATVALTTGVRSLSPTTGTGDVGAGILPGSRILRFASSSADPLQAAIDLTASGVGAEGETDSGYIRHSIGAANPLVTTGIAAIRYAQYDNYDLKNQDLEVEVRPKPIIEMSRKNSF
jgi:hypothetical protein